MASLTGTDNGDTAPPEPPQAAPTDAEPDQLQRQGLTADQLPHDIVLWTRYEYSVKLRPDGSGAAETRIVTWTPGGTDGTATLDRWSADHLPIAVSPEQCQAAQIGLERSAERMREQADRGAFGEPTLGSMLVLPGATQLAAPAPAPTPVPVAFPPAPTAVARASTVAATSHLSSRTKTVVRAQTPSPSTGSRSPSRSPPPARRGRRHRRSFTPSSSPSPRRRRRSRTRSRSRVSRARPRAATPLSPPPKPQPPALRPEDAVRTSSPNAKPRAKKSAAAKPAVAKQGAMAKQSQSWKTAWTFNTLPGNG